MSPPEAFPRRDRAARRRDVFGEPAGRGPAGMMAKVALFTVMTDRTRPEPHPGAIAFCIAAKAVFTAPALQFRDHRHREERGLDAAWSILVQVLGRVTGPFLSFGSML